MIYKVTKNNFLIATWSWSSGLRHGVVICGYQSEDIAWQKREIFAALFCWTVLTCLNSVLHLCFRTCFFASGQNSLNEVVSSGIVRRLRYLWHWLRRCQGVISNGHLPSHIFKRLYLIFTEEFLTVLHGFKKDCICNTCISMSVECGNSVLQTGVHFCFSNFVFVWDLVLQYSGMKISLLIASCKKHMHKLQALTSASGMYIGRDWRHQEQYEDLETKLPSFCTGHFRCFIISVEIIPFAIS